MMRFALLLFLALPALGADSLLKEAERQRAPDFELQDAAGKTTRMADYAGKVVLLNFWATWCIPCREEIPWFSAFSKSYEAQGLDVLGISLDEHGWDAVKPYLKKMAIPYRVALGDARTAFKYGKVETLPVTFLVDRQRRVAAIHFGLVNRKKVEQEIRTLLETPSN